MMINACLEKIPGTLSWGPGIAVPPLNRRNREYFTRHRGVDAVIWQYVGTIMASIPRWRDPRPSRL
jgi:hypothetical protein